MKLLFLIKKSVTSKILKRYLEVHYMKKNKLNSLLSAIAAVAIVATFLFLIAKAVCFGGKGLESYVRGYDLMFGNDAGMRQNDGDALPAFIAVFVFLVVGGVFSVLGTIFNLLGDDNTSHKFVSFLSAVSGLLFAASAVIFFLAPMFFDAQFAASLYWGGIACGACTAVAAVASLISGVNGLLVK